MACVMHVDGPESYETINGLTCERGDTLAVSEVHAEYLTEDLGYFTRLDAGEIDAPGREVSPATTGNRRGGQLELSD